MLTSPTKIAPRIGVLLAGVALIFAGCDIVGQKGSVSLLEVTNDLDERMTVYSGDKTVSLQSAAKASSKSGLSLKVVSRIQPPRSGRSASHVSVSGTDVFAGYKIPGPTFGGGVDILDRQDPTHLTREDNALQSPDLDVQEVAYQSASGDNNLYVAGAVDYGNIDARDYGNTPAVLIRALIDGNGNVVTDSDGDVQAVESPMPDHLVKSVAVATSSDGTHDVYAVTDGDSFFEFDAGLGSKNVISSTTPAGPDGIGGGTEFNSVTSFDGSNYALAFTKAGPLYEIGTAGGDVGKVYKRSVGLNPVAGIARITSFEHTSAGNSAVTGDYAYVALRDGGLAVLNKSGNVVYAKGHPSLTDASYVAIAVAEHSSGSDRIYASGPGGTIDVFEVTDAIDDGDRSTGLELTGSFDLGGLDEIQIGPGSIGSAQVNSIAATDTYLFVAAADEGVLTLEIAEGEGDIF